MVLLILPTRPCLIIAGSPSSPAMLIFFAHFWIAFSKVEMLLTSCLSSAWNQNYNKNFSVKSHKNPYLINQIPFLFSKATLTAAWRRDFILKFYFGLLNQVLVSTKLNEKIFFSLFQRWCRWLWCNDYITQQRSLSNLLANCLLHLWETFSHSSVARNCSKDWKSFFLVASSINFSNCEQ